MRASRGVDSNRVSADLSTTIPSNKQNVMTPPAMS